jgi:hypothetical protein
MAAEVATRARAGARASDAAGTGWYIKETVQATNNQRYVAMAIRITRDNRRSRYNDSTYSSLL